METVGKAVSVLKNEGIIPLLSRFPTWFRGKLRRWRGVIRSSLYTHTDREPVLDMETPAGLIRFEADPAWFRFNEIKSGGVYEPVLLEALNKSLTEDDTFYNVGARYGIFSIFANRCGVKNTNIHSFEADERNIEFLRRNLKEGMSLKTGFVSDTIGAEQFTLDSYAENHSPPTVIKIDIEGAELRAIEGAEKILSEHKPELYVEVHKSIQNFDDRQVELIDRLRSHGYEISISNHRSNVSDWEPLPDELPDSDTYMINAT